MIHVDTHVLIWIFKNRFSKLSPQAKRLVRNGVVISPMVLLELDTLPASRGMAHAEEALATLSRALKIDVSPVRFDLLMEQALRIGWTRDPFDRLIVANAMAEGERLLSADETILANFEDAVW